MKKQHAFLVLVLIVLCSMSRGQSREVTLNGALDLAKNRNPLLLGSLYDIESAQARASMRNAGFRPQFSINGTAAVGEGSMIFPSTVMPVNYALLPKEPSTILNATTMWKFWTAGRDRVAQRLGLAEVSQYRFRSELLRLSVEYRIRESFSNVLFRKDVVHSKQVALETANEMLRVTQSKFESGSVPKAFVLRAEADVAAMKREVVMAEADLEMAEAMLRERIGVDQSSEVRAGNWDQELAAPPTKQEAIEFAVAHHPQLAMAKLDIETADLKQEEASRSRLPEAALMAMGDWMGTRRMQATTSAKVGIVVSFPLGDGGERNAAIAEFRAMAKKMQQERRMLELQIQAETASAYAQWASVNAQRDAARAQVVASEEAYRVMQERFDAGKAVLVELIDARSQVLLANVSLAEVENFARRSWSELMRAMGGVPAQ